MDPGLLRSDSDTPPTHYTLKLEGFSYLVENNVERYTTAEFEAGGYKWKLILYPKGNESRNANDNISVYIMLVESSLPHLRSEVHATFRVFLFDHNNDNYYTLHEANGRRFHKMKLECGFDQFMPLEKFNDPSNGYLVDDTCVFGAEVYVYKENKNGKGEHLEMVKHVKSYKHTWKIDSFSTLATKEIHYSMTFYSGGHEWRIHLYPKGNGEGKGNHLSIFLGLANPASLPVAFQICAESTLRIIDQVNANNRFHKFIEWFSVSNDNYGLQSFIKLTDFNASSKGYLVKDRCIIEAEVTVHGVTTVL